MLSASSPSGLTRSDRPVLMGVVNVTPEHTVAQQDELHGRDLFARDPGACCGMRKVEPLKAALAGYEQSQTVLSTRLVAGQPVIHVLADAAPDAGFEQVPADLEDVYFGELRKAAPVAATARA